MEKNLYEILGVSKYSSTENIENTYNILKFKYQEKYKGEENKIELEKRLSILKNAYEILHDNKKRSEYDKFLREKEESKKEIEENIRNISEDNFEQSINNTFSTSDDVQLPEVEELSKEEVENKKQELENNESKEIPKKDGFIKNKINISFEQKPKIEVFILLTVVVTIIIIACAAYFKSKVKEKQEEQPVFTPEDIEVLDKKIETGERLPEEILNITEVPGKFEDITGLWFYYSKDYNIYYKRVNEAEIELYYDQNKSIEDGALWLYDKETTTSFIYDDDMECFVGYSSLNKKLFFIAYDKQNKTFGYFEYTNDASDEYYTELDTTQHTIYKEDINGNIYFINENDQFEEAKAGEYALFTDNRGRICYIDKIDGSRYYIDEYSYLKYYRDENGKYYFEQDNLRYYEYDILGGCPYYKDINGNVFCREEDGSKLYDYEDMLLMFE